jgi:hypothetical protein
VNSEKKGGKEVKDTMKGMYMTTVILLIALALPFGAPLSFGSAHEESVGTTLPSVSAEEESDGILFGFYGGGITREPAAETMVQLSIAHTCEINDELILTKVEVCGETGVSVQSFEVNRTLNSISEKRKRLDELLKQLANTTDEAEYVGIYQEAGGLVEEMRAQLFSTEYFTIDLRQIKQSLTVGDKIPLTAKATLIHNGEALVIERGLSVEYHPSLSSSPLGLDTVSSTPELLNWKRGVQHVHTGHSDWDASYLEQFWRTPPTVLNQTEAAKDRGLSWIIITDHEETTPVPTHHGLTSEEWLDEREECARAENETGIQVMCGEEVGDCFPFPLLSCPRGHYLAYNISSFITWPCDMTAQQMINMISQSNEENPSPRGFGFIAHPSDPAPGGWNDWSVTGYAGLEIMNGPTASNITINKWTEILQNSSARVFAVGNPDAHWPEEIASSYTWCDIGETVDDSSIYSALRNGHSVASNGPLIAFTIGDKRIGDTVTTTYENVFLDIAWDSYNQSAAIQRIEVYTNQGNVQNITNVSGTTGSTSVIVWVNPQTLYVRLRGIFSNGEAYTNPIWIVYTPPPGGGGCPFLQVWNGSDHIDEGLLDIHNAEGVDVTYDHTLTTVPEPVNGAYAFRLTEHPKTISDIDQVQLQAILEDGTVEQLPLKKAWHSEDGNVRKILLNSDDWRVEEKGADHNGGISQSIDLEFATLGPNAKAVAFVFTIEGYNMICKWCE